MGVEFGKKSCFRSIFCSHQPDYYLHGCFACYYTWVFINFPILLYLGHIDMDHYEYMMWLEDYQKMGNGSGESVDMDDGWIVTSFEVRLDGKKGSGSGSGSGFGSGSGRALSGSGSGSGSGLWSSGSGDSGSGASG